MEAYERDLRTNHENGAAVCNSTSGYDFSLEIIGHGLPGQMVLIALCIKTRTVTH